MATAATVWIPNSFVDVDGIATMIGMSRIVRAQTPAQLDAARALRVEVFVREQGVNEANEFDEFDTLESTIHCVAYDDVSVAIATGRLIAPTEVGGHDPHLGRIAVAADARGSGAGTAVTQWLEAAALKTFGDHGKIRVRLSAQTHAIPFYERLGYTISGPEYMEEGIPHRSGFKEICAQ